MAEQTIYDPESYPERKELIGADERVNEWKLRVSAIASGVWSDHKTESPLFTSSTLFNQHVVQSDKSFSNRSKVFCIIDQCITLHNILLGSTLHSSSNSTNGSFAVYSGTETHRCFPHIFMQ